MHRELLRTKGFPPSGTGRVVRRGIYQSDTDPEAEMAVFRVEISSEQNLSDAVKQAIAQAAPGCDLSRVGADLFRRRTVRQQGCRGSGGCRDSRRRSSIIGKSDGNC